MLLTLVKNNVVIVCLFGMLMMHGRGEAQYTLSHEIISNDMYACAGNGDTLWVLSSKGVNFTSSIIDSPVVWNAFKDLRGWDITTGGGYALIRTTKDYTDYDAVGTPGPLWLYHSQTKTQTDITLPFIISSPDDSLLVQASAAVWHDGAFWMTCMQGGLVRLDVSDNSQTIFYPGRSGKAYTGFTFNTLPDTFSLASDSTFALDIAEGAGGVWVACRKALWFFNPADTTWTPVADSLLGVTAYLDIESRLAGDTTTLYVRLAHGVSDTSLVTYNNQTGEWHTFVRNAGRIASIAVAGNGLLYALDLALNEIILYKDTLQGNSISFALPYAAEIDTANFQYRMTNADQYGVGNFTISDMHYAVHGTDTLFQIVTDIGLFYSNNEHYDETHAVPFHLVRRNVTLQSDLGKTYAYPGILNNSHLSTVFAYTLARDDKVTIDIFDYNMDHVVRIVESAPRQAGSKRTNGRSTQPQFDRWDGTLNNNNGTPVVPGVYFYRIKTGKGKRAFGKIIVARN